MQLTDGFLSFRLHEQLATYRSVGSSNVPSGPPAKLLVSGFAFREAKRFKSGER
jgi:hypothetical protein